MNKSLFCRSLISFNNESKHLHYLVCVDKHDIQLLKLLAVYMSLRLKRKRNQKPSRKVRQLILFFVRLHVKCSGRLKSSQSSTLHRHQRVYSSRPIIPEEKRVAPLLFMNDRQLFVFQ